jgi:hypothetical protein
MEWIRRTSQRPQLASAFVVPLAIAMLAVVAAHTVEHDQFHLKHGEAPAGASSLARPHPPLDRGPGEALENVPYHREGARVAPQTGR